MDPKEFSIPSTLPRRWQGNRSGLSICYGNREGTRRTSLLTMLTKAARSLKSVCLWRYGRNNSGSGAGGSAEARRRDPGPGSAGGRRRGGNWSSSAMCSLGAGASVVTASKSEDVKHVCYLSPSMRVIMSGKMPADWNNERGLRLAYQNCPGMENHLLFTFSHGVEAERRPSLPAAKQRPLPGETLRSGGSDLAGATPAAEGARSRRFRKLSVLRC